MRNFKKQFKKHGPSLRAALLATAAVAVSIALPAKAADEVTADRLLNVDKEPGNWVHHHKDYSATRFSSLSDINKGNVKNLKVAWTMHLGGVEGGGIWSHGGLEGTPVVENGMMYVTDGWGSVYKIDTHGGKGVLLWKMDPKTDHDWAGAVACCGVDNRGVALWGNIVISHTLDGRLIATDKETGQVAWQRQVANPDKGEVVTGAPLIVKNMAITGVAGAEYGIRGWIAATDLTTQKEVWRTHTIPAKGEPGADTWKDDKNSSASGGGSTWVTGSNQHHCLGHRESWPGLGQRVSARRQSLYRQLAGARCRYREDQVALPAHAQRSL
jgi:alcohol dehydrogenase (cytochrome c)